MIKLKLSSQLIGQFGHMTPSASCKQPEKHSSRVYAYKDGSQYFPYYIKVTLNTLTSMLVGIQFGVPPVDLLTIPNLQLHVSQVEFNPGC